MKIFKILLVFAITFGMMACNNEEVPQVNDGPEATISIKVFPSSNGPSFRATGDLTGNGILPAGLAAESAIKTLEVWVFAGDVLDGYGISTIAKPDEVNDIVAHIGTRTVVVVANAQLGNTYTSKATLLGVLKELPADIATKGLIMTAEPFEVNLKKGKNYYGYDGIDVEGEETYLEKDPLAITRVNARVAIVSAELNTNSIPVNQQPIFDKLGDVQVAMFNVPNETNLFYARTNPLATDLATNANYLYGAQWTSPANTYEGVSDDPENPTASLTDATVVGLPVTIDKAPYYYVNESSVENKMFIVLRAKLYKGTEEVTPTNNPSLIGLYIDSDGYTYYPIWVNGKDLGYEYTSHTADGKVVRNTQYNITLSINGLGNPTIDPVDKAWLDVKVEVAPWTVVNQNVTWGTPAVTPAP